MVQGTGSSVGKSLITAALCRAFAREGLRVLPYKSQNMSNNAAAVPGGGEIGRAQALQAASCRVIPTVDMNPVLLKPEGDARSQVVLLGRPWKTLSAREYHLEKDILWAAASAALDRLRAKADLVVIEGAGSPAEINLREDEIVNMKVARYANSPVILVGDIDPGGVFAQFVGTLALLEPEERALVKGLVINKFRGDISLLEPGLDFLRERCGLPVLGVLPWIRGIGLAEEDGAVLETRPRASASSPSIGRSAVGVLDIAVIRLPRISNFDDLDALSLEAGVSVRFVSGAEELGDPDAIVIPGTKATLADLDWLRERGLDLGIRWLARRGRSILGICGGFQMLGESIDDPDGVEGRPRRETGLGLLPLRTTFGSGKRTVPRRGRVASGLPAALAAAGGAPVEGYEIHAGESRVEGPPLFELEAVPGIPAAGDGTWAAEGRIVGTYLHGLFDLPDFRRAWLVSIDRRGTWQGGNPKVAGIALADARDLALDRLADAVTTSLDMDELRRIVGLDTPKEGT